MLTFYGTVTTLLAATLLSVLDGSQLALPRSPSPVIDGTAADAEWKAAWRSTNRDTTLFLLHDGEDIYAAVKSPGFAITSVYVARGDELKILHASAAIGEAVYRRDAQGAWRLQTKFAFTRYKGPEDIIARGKGFFDEHGWLSSHMRLGAPGDTEFRLQGRSLDGARVAITYYDPERRNVLLAYPAGLAGDVVAHEIQAGYTPDVLKIQPESWVTLKR